jgi:glycosyltransferase involved in cell wall biosynthesis
MRICLVTSFPPSRHHLSEYGFHLAEQLRTRGIQCTVLADEYLPLKKELPGFDVLRCWRCDDLSNGARILHAVGQVKPDVVWFNLVYSTFGSKAIAAFLGLCTPAMTRACGYRTHVDLRHADVAFPRVYRCAGSLATRLLLCADSVSVLQERYRRALLQRYGARNVAVRPHGTLGIPCAARPWLRDKSEFRILAFGKWGRYKRLEPILEVFSAVLAQVPRATLLIGGCDHPNRPGYMARLAEEWRSQPRIQWLGYLEEARLGQVFRSSHVVVMPYLSSGGPSGVAHLACRFGLPIVSAAIEDLVELAGEEGMSMDTYDPSDPAELGCKLVALARDPERQARMGEQNYQVALNATMPKLVRSYLSEFARLTGEADHDGTIQAEEEAVA